jgi:nucleoporin NUP82
MLTPDTLRYLGKTVERFTVQIRDIQLANGAAEARSELQQQEFARQEAKHAEMIEMIERLTDQRQTAFQEKLRRIQERQGNLLARFDRILQVMIAKASPELSEHETKWFEELRRMKEEVNGGGRWDEGSLVARTKMVRFLQKFEIGTDGMLIAGERIQSDTAQPEGCRGKGEPA